MGRGSDEILLHFNLPRKRNDVAEKIKSDCNWNLWLLDKSQNLTHLKMFQIRHLNNIILTSSNSIPFQYLFS